MKGTQITFNNRNVHSAAATRRRRGDLCLPRCDGRHDARGINTRHVRFARGPVQWNITARVPSALRATAASFAVVPTVNAFSVAQYQFAQLARV